MVGAVGIGWEVAPRMVERDAQAPGVRAWVVDVDFVGRIGRYSAATHHIQPSVEVQPSRLTGSSRYSGNRANGVSYWIEAEGSVGVHHRATLVV